MPPAVGHLCLLASVAKHDDKHPSSTRIRRILRNGCAHVGSDKGPQNVVVRTLECGRSHNRNGDRAPGIPRQVDQIKRRKSPDEKTRVAEHGSQEQGTKGQGEPGKQAVRWIRCIWRWEDLEDT